MGIKNGTCYWLDCDGCDGWDCEEGSYHFDTAEQAIRYANRDGWLVLPDRTLCPMCAAQLDCELTGHQWSEWEQQEDYGVSYLERDCEHCGIADTEPPKRQLRLLLWLARNVDESEGGSAV
jgi:hypothetical protein